MITTNEEYVSLIKSVVHGHSYTIVMDLLADHAAVVVFKIHRTQTTFACTFVYDTVPPSNHPA